MSTDNPQVYPEHNEYPEVWKMVIGDMEARNEFGKNKYRTALQPFNVRNALRDKYEEQLDALVYTRQEMYEKEWLYEGLEFVISHLESGNIDNALKILYMIMDRKGR